MMVVGFSTTAAAAAADDPEDPSDSVLEPGMTAMVYLFPAIGGLFLVIGVGILIFLLLSRSSSKEL